MRQHLLFAGGLTVVLGLSVWLLLAVAVQGDPHSAVAWTRSLEPVVLTGSQLAQFDGAALDDLFVYAYSGSTWQQIPFQFDEVDASGAYTTTEDNLLDENDELVFMVMDLGEEAGQEDWIADTDSQYYVRYQVQVTNPLSPTEQGWVYVYRSATLTSTFAGDYVDWDAGSDRIVAGTYIMGFASTSHAGVESLELNNGGVDVLDRTKIRIDTTCWIGLVPVPMTITEDDLADQFDVRPDIDGPVRVGGGNAENSTWAYHSLYQSHVTMNLDDLEPPDPCDRIDINWMRLSSDWLAPTDTGMAPATYYDSNTPAGVPIDGTSDAVPTTPITPWRQVSGGQGSTVQIADVAADGGTITNYYKDDQAVDADDTGDQRSFGDAGSRVDDPSGQVWFDLSTFVLDPGQANQGATYRSYYDNPLEVAVAAQRNANMVFVYLPLVLKNYP